MISTPSPRWSAVLLLILVFGSLIVLYRPDQLTITRDVAAGAAVSHSSDVKLLEHDLVKPEHVPVYGLIFFGRRDRVEILKCYLDRNLVSNGGWLDEIYWVRNTHDEEDLKYLSHLLTTNKLYKEIDISTMETPNQDAAYENAWTFLKRSAIYIKLDDDVTYIADDAIARLVTIRLADDNIYTVSANVINSPLMGWVHYHSGAMHPYLPEYPTTDKHSLPKPAKASWKYSSRPTWKGPADFAFRAEDAVPEHKHRWLRLPESSTIPTSQQMHRTPVAEIEYDTWGWGLRSWGIAAQEHYSFLENLERDPTLAMYKFQKLWTTDYARLSINMIAVLADDILDNLPMTGVVDGKADTPIADEEWLTVEMPKKLGRSVVVDTDALAVHVSFRTQSGVLRTDLLDRYRNYAKEKICLA